MENPMAGDDRRRSRSPGRAPPSDLDEEVAIEIVRLRKERRAREYRARSPQSRSPVRGPRPRTHAASRHSNQLPKAPGPPNPPAFRPPPSNTPTQHPSVPAVVDLKRAVLDHSNMSQEDLVYILTHRRFLSSMTLGKNLKWLRNWDVRQAKVKMEAAWKAEQATTQSQPQPTDIAASGQTQQRPGGYLSPSSSEPQTQPALQAPRQQGNSQPFRPVQTQGESLLPPVSAVQMQPSASPRPDIFIKKEPEVADQAPAFGMQPSASPPPSFIKKEPEVEDSGVNGFPACLAGGWGWFSFLSMAGGKEGDCFLAWLRGGNVWR
ncbi:MAG: hypothetical protein LQ343_002929 [Gyalolechia ehrenbergii]|nr:MAG: hypothetical protein LQ343_002929 [Gyalolechia ehrenbergii]